MKKIIDFITEQTIHDRNNHYMYHAWKNLQTTDDPEQQEAIIIYLIQVLNMAQKNTLQGHLDHMKLCPQTQIIISSRDY